MSLPVANLRWVTTNLDSKRVPLNGSERGERQGDIPYWGANGIVDFVDDYLINEPVILIGEDGAPFLDPHKEVAFQVDGPIWPNNHIHILRPDRNKVTDGFLKHWLNTVPYGIYINGSTRDKLTQAQLGSIKIELPPLETQRRVAAFLDEKTAQIDALIAKKQALLERLAEKRQAIITQAVTKGLNPAAPMRDSGIDWLGQIPAHWEVKRLKFGTSKIGSGVTPRGGASVYVDEGVMLLRSQNIHFDGLRLDDVAFIEPEIDREMAETRVQPYDVLLNITGASIGRCCIYDRTELEANVNQHVCIIRPKDEISASFVALILASPIGQLQIDLSQNGASREGLNFDDLGCFLVPQPDRHEQDEIAAHVQLVVHSLKSQASKVEASIATLAEYRSALITYAVTGQIEGLR